MQKDLVLSGSFKFVSESEYTDKRGNLRKVLKFIDLDEGKIIKIISSAVNLDNFDSPLYLVNVSYFKNDMDSLTVSCDILQNFNN